jgi:hypothetical protein
MTCSRITNSANGGNGKMRLLAPRTQINSRCRSTSLRCSASNSEIRRPAQYKSRNIARCFSFVVAESRCCISLALNTAADGRTGGGGVARTGALYAAARTRPRAVTATFTAREPVPDIRPAQGRGEPLSDERSSFGCGTGEVDQLRHPVAPVEVGVLREECGLHRREREFRAQGLAEIREVETFAIDEEVFEMCVEVAETATPEKRSHLQQLALGPMQRSARPFSSLRQLFSEPGAHGFRKLF